MYNNIYYLRKAKTIYNWNNLEPREYWIKKMFNYYNIMINIKPQSPKVRQPRVPHTTSQHTTHIHTLNCLWLCMVRPHATFVWLAVCAVTRHALKCPHKFGWGEMKTNLVSPEPDPTMLVACGNLRLYGQPNLTSLHHMSHVQSEARNQTRPWTPHSAPTQATSA
jgi:hypothetical protein